MSQMIRDDDFDQRRLHLSTLSDDELKAYFWELTEKIVDPLIALAKNNTSPAIERSIVLRMGFSSVEANTIVTKLNERGLLSKGAGHAIYLVSRNNQLSIREAGLALMEGKYLDQLTTHWKGASK